MATTTENTFDFSDAIVTRAPRGRPRKINLSEKASDFLRAWMESDSEVLPFTLVTDQVEDFEQFVTMGVDADDIADKARGVKMATEVPAVGKAQGRVTAEVNRVLSDEYGEVGTNGRHVSAIRTAPLIVEQGEEAVPTLALVKVSS